jgi:hypothetical protein
MNECSDTKLRSIILAGAMLASTHAFATCGYFSDGSELLVQHWEKSGEDYRKRTGADYTSVYYTSVDETYFARQIANAELCEKDAISLREYNARMAETIAQLKTAKDHEFSTGSHAADARALFL